MGDDRLLRELLDKQEISELLLSYGANIDARDWEAYADTFVEDGVFEIMGHVRRGRAEIVAGPKQDLERYAVLQHFSTNHRIEVDGDRAQASHYLLGIHGPDSRELGRHADIGGRYDCRCVRTPAGWRFAEVRMTLLWTAGETFSVQPDEG